MRAVDGARSSARLAVLACASALAWTLLLGCEPTRRDTARLLQHGVEDEAADDTHGPRWWTKVPPCAAGAVLAGAAPPAGDHVWCEREGEPEGPSTSFYPDGTRKSDAIYRAGELDGPWKQYFHGGKPRIDGRFARGEATGTWKAWFASGELASERVYVSAKEVRVRELRPGGGKAREGTLVDGEKHGAWIEYTDKGEALRQVWDHGVRVSGVDFVVGVKECDEYVARYTRCAEAQKDATQRAQFRESLRWTVQSWRDSLAQTGKPADLAAQCKQASDSMRQSAAGFGCTW